MLQQVGHTFISTQITSVVKTTSNFQFNEYYKNQPLYGGCLCKNEVAKLKRGPDNKFWILNMEDSDDGNGSHWVCCIDTLPGVVFYADPFGLAPPPPIVAFMRRSSDGANAVYSKGQYQQVESDRCGYFCIEFIDELLKDPRGWRQFDRDLTPQPSAQNEREVKKVRLPK